MPGYKKIYEDNWLLIIDKPADILTTPSPGNYEISLLDLLNSEYNPKRVGIFPCHRLDKETSELVIFAKDKQTQGQIMDLFRKREIRKKYIAIVQGWCEKNSGEIKNYLSESSRSDKRKKLAITCYRAIKKEPEYSIVEVQPLTGRKNQIRLHFKGLGHPIVGERRFAFAKDYEIKSKRLCLHARQLEFIHPRTEKSLKLFSAIPSHMRNFF